MASLFTFVSALLFYFQMDHRSPEPNVAAAVVSPTSMNVLYIGIDNPVQIAVPGYTTDKVSATGCGIRQISGVNYVARPSRVGNDTIYVTAGSGNARKTISAVFRIRRMPDPYIYIMDSKGGSFAVGKFKQAKGLTVNNPDFVFKLGYTIQSFEMVYAPKVGNVVTDISNSANFSKLMKDIQAKSKPGDVIVIQNAKVLMPDSSSVTLSTSFKIIG